MKKKGFTLVEMLIVMAILIILMGIGVFGGRALINRANRISHTNAVQQLNKAALQYYGDKGSVFPTGTTKPTPAQLVDGINGNTYLSTYLEDFDGGSDATYYYYISEDKTKVLFCVTNGGLSTSDAVDAVLCEGNAFGDEGTSTLAKVNAIEDDVDRTAIIDTILGTDYFTQSDWNGSTKSWGTAPAIDVAP
jgi:prepilin-type N-terminal cleavage/methylation domain-containing protein